jgi:hypothetical protein
MPGLDSVRGFGNVVDDSSAMKVTYLDTGADFSTVPYLIDGEPTSFAS